MNNNLIVDLSDIFDEILLSDEEISSAGISKWTDKYPQFTKEIREFAAFEMLDENLPEADALAETSSEVSAQRLEMVRGIVRSAAAEKSAEAEIESLAALAKTRDLKFPQLAKKLGLSLPILANLEQHFVKFASIPETVIENIAAVLQVTNDAVKSYLQLPPEMTIQASFKAKDKPEISKQEDFFTLVETDRMLTPEQKQNLLKLKK